ncbi:hypothetical protein AVEN_50435-1 [Araneus ventricosus]|uniref:Uncharacterized protein n=1 Tax=Araneus ventricosus TaxID=182803 RepID=A0A4Y2VG99_ARAVE|nr:hypothetical protein AVEN_50435-1 [Araneus ventricosus]
MFGIQIVSRIRTVGGLSPDFPLEISQQFLSLASSMGIVKKEDTPSLNMPGSLRRVISRWSNDYFLFPKLKEHLSGTKFSSESDVKTVDENWLIG